jgi:hypothetical protein
LAKIISGNKWGDEKRIKKCENVKREKEARKRKIESNMKVT